jgi:hypothetical protein
MDGLTKMLSICLICRMRTVMSKKKRRRIRSLWRRKMKPTERIPSFLFRGEPNMLARNKIVLLYQAKGAAQVRNAILFLTLEGERLGQRIKCRLISYCGGRKVRPEGQVHSGGGCVTHAFSSNFLNTNIELSMTKKTNNFCDLRLSNTWF